MMYMLGRMLGHFALPGALLIAVYFEVMLAVYILTFMNAVSGIARWTDWWTKTAMKMIMDRTMFLVDWWMVLLVTPFSVYFAFTKGWLVIAGINAWFWFDCWYRWRFLTHWKKSL